MAVLFVFSVGGYLGGGGFVLRSLGCCHFERESMGVLTVKVPNSIEQLWVICVIRRSRRRARPIGSAVIDFGAVVFTPLVALLQLKEAGGERLAALTLPRS